jgi:ATP-binding cassette subfamily C protein CydCD
VDIAGLRGDDVRRLVGWCPADAHLFDATVRDNLRVARPGATDDELVEALAGVGLGTWVGALPAGLGTRVGPGGRALSGGEAQRLRIARTLLADPAVVVFDEPTAKLDRDSATALLGDLERAAAGRTTIVITHRPEGLGPAVPVVALGDGRPASACATAAAP